MQTEELERIRMLENRMRNPSKNSHNLANEESLVSIKSTDSKKIVAQHQRVEEKIDEIPSEMIENDAKLSLSEEELKHNKKITDYFLLKPNSNPKPQGEDAIHSPIVSYLSKVNVNPVTQTKSASSADSKDKEDDSKNKENERSSEESKTKEFDKNELEIIKEENRLLREKVKQKDELVGTLKDDIVALTERFHKIKRNEMRLRVNANKIRLGEYYTDKKGKESWVDGTEIRDIKEKLDEVIREREQTERNKKTSKKSLKEYAEDPEEWKNSLSSQGFYLAREEAHLNELLRRLEEEKTLHIKEYKMLYEEEHSKYGKFDPVTGIVTWPKIKKYQFLGLLGKGGFSEVYKAFDIEELREVACKVHEYHLNWTPSAKDSYVKHAIRENNVHKMLCHPNIVKLYDTVEIEANSFCTVLEYCEGPDLSYYLKKHKKIPEKEAKAIIRQVISAIRYLHEMRDKVIHYDLKPQNIMFHKGKIKITDFGLCKTTKEEVIELTSQGVGTYWYLPPECFETDKKAVITPKVDIWSIGVIYFELLYGEKPFGNQMSQLRILNEGIMLKANSVMFPNTQKGTVSDESKDFLKKCLCFSVNERIDIKAAATHRLFDKK